MGPFEIIHAGAVDYSSAVPLSLAMAQIRQFDGDLEGDLTSFYRDAACELVERRSMKLLVKRQVTWKGRLSSWRPAIAGVGPVHRIVSGSYFDRSGVAQVFPTTGAGIEQTVTGIRIGTSGLLLPIVGGDWPGINRADEHGSVSLVIEAGYEPGAIPMPLIQAALFMIGHYDRHRESVVSGSIASDIPQTFDTLIDSVRAPVI